MTGELSMQLAETGSRRHHLAGLLLGAGFTLLLFLGLAQIKSTAPEAPPVDLLDLPSVALPMEVPPPLPELAPPESAAPVTEMAAFESGDTSSPVKITVAPPEISALLPVHASAPSLKVINRVLPADLKPRMDVAPDFQRIYQQSEVDQRPKVISESNPFIPPVVRRNATRLRVVLLFVIDTTGSVASVRIVESSGNAPFDQIVADCIKDKWMFSPAIKKGKRVKCMVQRAIIVNWKLSPFEG
jgi:TonB family protein